MNKEIFINKRYKNRGSGYIYYTLEKVINKTKDENNIFILYGDLMVGNQLYIMNKSQFLEEFNICND